MQDNIVMSISIFMFVFGHVLVLMLGNPATDEPRHPILRIPYHIAGGCTIWGALLFGFACFYETIIAIL